MACFSPLYVRYYDGKFVRFGGRLTDTISPSDPLETIVPVPCGKCDGCRLDRSKRWADRMLLEFEVPAGGLPPRKALFLTLTYDDAHLPKVVCTDRQCRGNLSVRDTQLFVKRLRKLFYPRKLRFFLCGEYGGLTFRPHYHMILFGADLSDFPDAFPWSDGEQDGTINYMSMRLMDVWQNGNILFSPANYQTFAYVARYVLKKQFGSDGSLFYRGRKPPFVTMSRNPGLGSAYDFGDNTSTTVFDGIDVKTLPRPRTDFLKLKDSDPYLYDVLSAARRERARKHNELILSNTDLSYLEYCDVQKRLFNDRTNVLKHRKL